MKPLTGLQGKFAGVWPLLDERTRRLLAANEARSLRHGGVARVSRACGLSRKAISKGIRGIETGQVPPPGRMRQAGAGRRKITEHNPRLIDALEFLIDPETRGAPESPLRWTCKSTRNLAKRLVRQKHYVSHTKFAQLLHALGYSLQSNRKTQEGEGHPDRDAQFRHISMQVKRALSKGTPVVSVDTKKKELVGNYANGGEQWLPGKSPVKVKGHDFPHPDVPRAYPYGVYDVGSNTGFVNLGTDHDTGAFAVASIRGWLRHEERHLYPAVKELLITADARGSNGSRLRLWKVELQRMSDEIELSITVCHFPPGTSKCNKIEHRLFSFISSNWLGEPLCDYETIVNLISKTMTAKGLKVICRLDRRKYPIGRKVTDEEMKNLNPERHSFHGDWNYTIKPRYAKNILYLIRKGGNF